MNSKIFLFAPLLVFVLVSSAFAQKNTTTTEAPTTNATASTTPATTKAKTTAPVNTTTPVAKNTTTPAKTTPATTVPTTTPKPENVFEVKDGNVTCVKMQADITFDITYLANTKNKTDKENKTVTITLPKTYTVAGNCKASNVSQTMAITFNKDWLLTFTFTQGSDAYHVSEVSLKYKLDAKNFPNAVKQGDSMTAKATAKSDFLKAGSKNYYVCDSKTSMDLNGDVEIDTKNLKYGAFNKKGDIKFSGSVSECSADEDTNSIVPIAVGAALAGLVVIVLIAYLIGRKRTRKTGYESV